MYLNLHPIALNNALWESWLPQARSTLHLCSRIAGASREYFLGEIDGFRQLLRLPKLVIDLGQCTRLQESFSFFAPFASACEGSDGVMGLFAPFGAVSKVLAPLPRYSIVRKDCPASSYEQICAKVAEVADWLMLVCESFRFLVLFGFAKCRNYVPILYVGLCVVYSLLVFRVEAIKWSSEVFFDPTSGEQTDFTWINKIGSLFTLAVTIASLALAAFAFCEIFAIPLAGMEFLSLIASAAESSASIAGSLWQNLQASPNTD